LARELGVDLHQVTPTGPGGIVTAEDVRAFAEGHAPDGEAAQASPAVGTPARPLDQPSPAEQIAAPEPTEAETLPTGPSAAPPLPDFGRWGPVERMPLRSVRRATAVHMALAWSQIPHVNHQDVADVTRLEEFRRQHLAEVESAGGKLTLAVFVLKAVVAALKIHPRFNSSLDAASQEIVLKRYYHLGVAVDSEKGLIVPVLRDVDRKSLLELSVELSQMAQRTRSGEVALEDLQGGTFTITNIGALGGTGFSPIINYPQVAILGMGRARLQPVVVGDETDFQIMPRLLMPLVLAFDHRVLDGADAARFLRLVIECRENPVKLWLRI
jgi:pyruvate dehydrogenase E2 component (dihydrolipoamide acetyltransferase)